MKVVKGELDRRGKDLKDVLEALRNLADHVESDIKYGPDDAVDSEDPKLMQKIQQLREQMNAVDQKWHALLAAAGGTEAEIPVRKEERLRFSDFLNSIGEAMLETQRYLDSESLAYLRENSTKPHVLPSIFRMPRLSAEMKFALEKESEKEVNLIFFKNQNLAKELHQQSIKFELVSTPPPPDALEALRAPASHPSVKLALEGLERQKVLEAALAAKGEHALPPDAEHDRIIILEVSPGEGSIVLYAEPKGRNKIGVWLFSENKFRGIYKFDKANDTAENYLRAFISNLADIQQAWLSAH